MPDALELTLALRYLRARQASRFASFMSLASMIGIAIGVCALITILSVMNGFEAELRGRLLGLQTEASVAARSGGLSDWMQLRDRVLELPEIVGAAPSVSVEGMANADGRLVPVLIEGIDPELERSISSLDESMVSGRLDALASDDFGVILGRYLALDLGVEAGDDIVVLVPRPTAAGVQPELVRLRVVGVFNAGVPEYDGGVGWM
ncbi:MAG: ABC transporter permease, partial [Pseudomonadota bacterium]